MSSLPTLKAPSRAHGTPHYALPNKLSAVTILTVLFNVSVVPNKRIGPLQYMNYSFTRLSFFNHLRISTFRVNIIVPEDFPGDTT